MSDLNKSESWANSWEVQNQGWIKSASWDTLDQVSSAMNNTYSSENNIENISDIDDFINVMLEKWLVWVPNFNNGTMYYIPEDAIDYYTSVSRVWSIKLGNDDEISTGTKNFVKALECQTTWEFWKIWIKTEEWDIELTDQKTRPENLFATIEKVSWCIKLSWLDRTRANIKNLLFTMRDWKIKNISFTDKESWIPHDMSMYSV